MWYWREVGTEEMGKEGPSAGNPADETGCTPAACSKKQQLHKTHTGGLTRYGGSPGHMTSKLGRVPGIGV